MKNVLKKCLSFSLCLSLATSSLVSAAPIASLGNNSVPLVLSVTPTTFDVSVPTTLPVNVDAVGNVVTADTAKVVNNSPMGNIVVSAVEVLAENSWQLEDFDTDFRSKKVNTKEISFKLNNEKVDKSTGKPPLEKSNWGLVASNGGELVIAYSAKVPVQAMALTNEAISYVTFTVDWDYAEVVEAPLPAVVKASDYSYTDVEGGIRLTYNGTATIIDYIPNEIDGKKVVSLGNTFVNKTTITEITATIPDSVITILGAFKGCTSLITAPVIPNSVTSMINTFYGCTSLTGEIIVPNSVTNMMNTFYGCTSLVTAPIISNSITAMQATFYGCTSLITAPVIPNSVTSMGNTFYGCTSLVTAPVTPNSIAYMSNTFMGCTNLTGEIIIPNTVTSMIECFTDTVKPITMYYTTGHAVSENYTAPANVTKVAQ